MSVSYIIAIVSAVVLLALNLIRDYGKKGWFLAAILFITQEERAGEIPCPFLLPWAIFRPYFTVILQKIFSSVIISGTLQCYHTVKLLNRTEALGKNNPYPRKADKGGSFYGKDLYHSHCSGDYSAGGQCNPELWQSELSRSADSAGLPAEGKNFPPKFLFCRIFYHYGFYFAALCAILPLGHSVSLLFPYFKK